MSDGYELKKLTDCNWLNLYEADYQRAQKHDGKWIMTSRKNNPIADAAEPDAVYIVPVIKTDEGNKLAVTKEFRVPIWDYEWGLPAGLIDGEDGIEETVKRELKEETGLDLVSITHISMPVYSSAGMTDESCVMVLAEVQGNITKRHQEKSEDIETVLLDVDELKKILRSKNKVSAKAWGMFYHFAVTGKIEI